MATSKGKYEKRDALRSEREEGDLIKLGKKKGKPGQPKIVKEYETKCNVQNGVSRREG